ncbi:MAG: energy transducer TonB [bacterium]|nr:energy transducer TonB [bacterium]
MNTAVWEILMIRLLAVIVLLSSTLAQSADAGHYRKNPPKECKTIDPGDFTFPPITMLKPAATDSCKASPHAEVWVKCRIDSTGKAFQSKVVWCSIDDTTFETTALEYVNTTIFDSIWTGYHGREGWLYHMVLFRQQDDHKCAIHESTPSDTGYVPVEVLPEMIKQVQPAYPRDARHRNASGTVWVKALVSKFGTVEQVKIGHSSGDAYLDNAALLSGYRNKYKPAIQRKKPVAVWVMYRVDFKLTNR